MDSDLGWRDRDVIASAALEGADRLSVVRHSLRLCRMFADRSDPHDMAEIAKLEEELRRMEAVSSRHTAAP